MNSATTTPVVVPDATTAPIAPAVSAVTPTKVINTARAIAADDIPAHGAGSYRPAPGVLSRSEAGKRPQKTGKRPPGGRTLSKRCLAAGRQGFYFGGDPVIAAGKPS